MKGSCIFLVLAVSVCAFASRAARAQDQIVLGTSTDYFQFVGTGTSVINGHLSSHSMSSSWNLAYGNASGSGALGSGGRYSITAAIQNPITLSPLGNGVFSVAQGAPLSLTYTSTGSWGYRSGTLLLAGNLSLSTIAMAPGSSTVAIAAGILKGTGGIFASKFATPGPVSITLALSGSLNSLVKAKGTINAVLNYPSTITDSPPPPPLTITTSSLPSGMVGQTYSATLTATGGTLPYTWSIASGPLPAGLALQSSSGLVSGTPTAGGDFSFTVQVQDSSSPPQTANAAFSVSVSNSGQGGLTVTTTSLASGVAGQAYSATLMATGGISPFTWTVSSGALPAGVTLSAQGALAGSPTQAGPSTVTLQASDTSTPPLTGTKSFTIQVQAATDAYGGSPQLPCPTGAAAHFYTQKIGNRWWLCTPAGNAFWMRGVYVVDVNDSIDYQGVSYSNMVEAKYGDSNLTWAPQANRRLKSWGFNSLAEYASIYALPTTTESSWPNNQQPVPMPFTALAWPAYYALINSGNYASGPVKELVRATNPNVFTGYRGDTPDVWDPNFGQWLDGWLQHDWAAPQFIHGPNNSYFVGFNVDDTDDLEGFGAGSEFKTVANGVASGGREQPHLGWIVLITPPTQTSNAQFGVTYTDTTVYSKQALMNILQAEYGTIAALNAAWGSNYSTFGSAGGWGQGTGLLDEDGTHSWVPRDFIALSDANAAMKADLNNFLYQHAQQYFSVIRAELNKWAPGRLYLGPTTLGTWGSPARAQVLQAAAPYLDVYMAASIPSGVPDDQQRMDFVAQNVGDKPWIEWEGFAGQPGSYMSPYQPGDTVQPQSADQPTRGQVYTNMLNQLTTARTTSGTYPVAGFKWWQFVDNWSEQMNWGLVTRRDNEYDGQASHTANGNDSWGFATGNEINNYGDFIDAVQNANLGVMPLLVSKQW